MAAKTVALDKPVPAFSLPVTGGGTWSLKDAAGTPLVLYFYPRDNTPGCTVEACDFRDGHGAFVRAANSSISARSFASRRVGVTT